MLEVTAPDRGITQIDFTFKPARKLWLPAMPRAEHLLKIAEHEFYHVGNSSSAFGVVATIL